MQISVSLATLTAAVRAGQVRVHKHGSGHYRGRYLALRLNTGNRPILATGRPEPLAAKLSSIGVTLRQIDGNWTANG